MAHAFNPNSVEAEAEADSLWVIGQPDLYNEFHASLGCTVRPFLKTKVNYTCYSDVFQVPICFHKIYWGVIKYPKSCVYV